MAVWAVDFLLTDARGNATTIGYNLGEFAGAIELQITNAMVAALELQNSLGNATDAEITQRTLSYTDTATATAHPITGQANVTDEAVVSLRLDSVSRQSAVLRIPAPTGEIVPYDGVEVNTNSALLGQFLADVVGRARFGPNKDVSPRDPADITSAYWRSKTVTRR